MKWIFFILLIGLLVGTVSAGFLWSLDLVTKTRIEHTWLYYTLPLIGGLIALIYARTNPKLSNGNVFIIQSFFNVDTPEKKSFIPLLLTPLILFGTLLTHLGGGSAGREGTAVQMGASISSQFNRWFSLDKREQRLLICIGISAGFAGVFGTPLAASIFAFEYFGYSKTKWYFVLPCLCTAYLADFICMQWGIQHAEYSMVAFSNYSFTTLCWIGLAGIIFGLAALLFIQSGNVFSKLFANITAPFVRPIIGGVLVSAFILTTHQEKMAGLGLSVIADAFAHQQGGLDFLIKLLLTSFTLSAGFKGGEVTPLFFIGAVLGSALIAFVPLPISLLAGLGLIAVFAGATHCLLSAIFLGIELFGMEYALYIILVCVIAYLFSGTKNIYEGRPLGKLKKMLPLTF